ncbi:unnamed protein product, partial [Prunus brigantina]
RNPTLFLSLSEINPHLIGRRLYRARSLSLLVTSLSLFYCETHSLSPNLTKHHPISLVFGANPCKF